MKKNILSISLSLIMALTIFSSCGNSTGANTLSAKTKVKSQEEATFSIYAQYADDDSKVPYDYAVKELEKAYPNVKLNLIIQSADDGATLETLANNGTLPDIYQSNSAIISSFKQSGNVYVLDDVAKATGYLDKVMDANLDLVYDSDGHIYCFPYAGNEYMLIYYNKEAFRKCNLEVPTTYDELLNCIEVFKANNIIPLEMLSEGWVYTGFFDIIATRYNPEGIKALDKGTAKISDSEYVKAAEMTETLVNAGIFQGNSTTTKYDEGTGKFYSGQAAMIINGQWFITEATEKMGDNVDWMYYPSYDEESYEKNKYAFSGGGSTSGFSVNPNSSNPVLAAEVAEFITEKYCEAKVLYRGTPLVAIETGLSPETDYPEMMKKLAETIPLMTSTTRFAWGLADQDFYDAITTYSRGLISGEYSADTFIQHVSDACR